MPYTPIAPEFKELAGEFGNGVLWNQLVVNPPTPEGEAQKSLLKDGEKNTGGLIPCPNMGCNAPMENAVEAVGKVDSYREIANYIESNPYEGLAGKYVYPKETHVAISGDEYVPAGFIKCRMEWMSSLLLKDTSKEFMIPRWIK